MQYVVDSKICICCFSAKNTILSSKNKKTGWFGIRLICQSGATCLPDDCCFSELSLLNSNEACWFRTKRASSYLIKMQLVLVMIQLKIDLLAINNTHLLTRSLTIIFCLCFYFSSFRHTQCTYINMCIS